MNDLEIIKNISLFLFSAVALVGLVVLYIRIFFIAKKIRKINKKIEEKQDKIDQNEIDDISGHSKINGYLQKNVEKHKKRLEHDIQKLKREKEYLLEEISIYKLFKK